MQHLHVHIRTHLQAKGEEEEEGEEEQVDGGNPSTSLQQSIPNIHTLEK